MNVVTNYVYHHVIVGGTFELFIGCIDFVQCHIHVPYNKELEIVYGTALNMDCLRKLLVNTTKLPGVVNTILGYQWCGEVLQ